MIHMTIIASAEPIEEAVGKDTLSFAPGIISAEKQKKIFQEDFIKGDDSCLFEYTLDT